MFNGPRCRSSHSSSFDSISKALSFHRDSHLVIRLHPFLRPGEGRHVPQGQRAQSGNDLLGIGPFHDSVVSNVPEVRTHRVRLAYRNDLCASGLGVLCQGLARAARVDHNDRREEGSVHAGKSDRHRVVESCGECEENERVVWVAAFSGFCFLFLFSVLIGRGGGTTLCSTAARMLWRVDCTMVGLVESRSPFLSLLSPFRHRSSLLRHRRRHEWRHIDCVSKSAYSPRYFMPPFQKHTRARRELTCPPKSFLPAPPLSAPSRSR